MLNAQILSNQECLTTSTEVQSWHKSGCRGSWGGGRGGGGGVPVLNSEEGVGVLTFQGSGV